MIILLLWVLIVGARSVNSAYQSHQILDPVFSQQFYTLQNHIDESGMTISGEHRTQYIQGIDKGMIFFIITTVETNDENNRICRKEVEREIPTTYISGTCLLQNKIHRYRRKKYLRIYDCKLYPSYDKCKRRRIS